MKEGVVPRPLVLIEYENVGGSWSVTVNKEVNVLAITKGDALWMILESCASNYGIVIKGRE